jgi:hypothetical protein
LKKEEKKRKQLAELGIEYDFPGYVRFDDDSTLILTPMFF